MIEQVPFYMAICDFCGNHWENDEIAAVIDFFRMEENLSDSDWHQTDDGKCYCPNCYVLDENDQIHIKSSNDEKSNNHE